MANLKYALIGYGRRGKSHLSVAMALQETLDIVGVCDADPQSAEEGAAIASAGRSSPIVAYTDLPKMIDQENPIFATWLFLWIYTMLYLVTYRCVVFTIMLKQGWHRPWD